MMQKETAYNENLDLCRFVGCKNLDLCCFRVDKNPDL